FFCDLAVWLVLNAVSNGPYLWLLPRVMTMPSDLSASSGYHASHTMSMSAGAQWVTLMAVGVHTAAYLFVMTLAAWIVYRKLGLAFLRTAWLNLDWLWAGALVTTGLVVLLR